MRTGIRSSARLFSSANRLAASRDAEGSVSAITIRHASPQNPQCHIQDPVQDRRPCPRRHYRAAAALEARASEQILVNNRRCSTMGSPLPPDICVGARAPKRERECHVLLETEPFCHRPCRFCPAPSRGGKRCGLLHGSRRSGWLCGSPRSRGSLHAPRLSGRLRAA